MKQTHTNLYSARHLTPKPLFILFVSLLAMVFQVLAFSNIANAAPLIVTSSPAPSLVDLSTEGSADWVHWGSTSATSVNRKAGVSPQIADYTLLASPAANRFAPPQGVRVTSAWTDGTPATSNSTNAGLYFRTVGNGYQITVPASTSLKTLRVYLGAWKARARVNVSLSDASASPFTTIVENPNGVIDRVIDIQFSAASNNQHLTLTYTLLDNFGVGNVTLSAATLANSENQPPVLSSVADQTITEGNTLTFNVNATDPDGPAPLTLTSTALPGSASFTDNADGTGSFQWTPAPGDASNSPYSVSFTATDGANLSSQQSLSIFVNPAPQNQAPVLNPVGNQTVSEGQTLSLTISATDADSSIPVLSMSNSTLPSMASFTDNNDGTASFTWSAAPGDASNSPYAITFVATDASDAALNHSETITINVPLPATGQLSASSIASPGDVNLTAEGTTDWLHWGRSSITSVNRKAGVAQQISNFALIGNAAVKRFQAPAGVRVSYAWSDGVPNSSSSTTAGLYVAGLGNGFSLSVPADTSSKTLKLYVGAWKARGRLDVSLSDGSAAPFITFVDNPNGVIDRVISIDFSAASNDQILNITYVIEDNYNGGNITLSAAALASTPLETNLPFSDAFDSDTTNWTVVDNVAGKASSWSIVNGRMEQTNRVESIAAFEQSYHLGSYAFFTAGATLDNYRFSVDTIYLADGLADDIGIMFRYQDDNNYYRLSKNSRYGFTRLEKKVNGVFTPLAFNARGYNREQLLSFAVDVNGSSIQIQINDEPIFSVTDSSLTMGSVALYSQDHSAFDNVLIENNGAAPLITLSSPQAYSVNSSAAVAASAIAANAPPGGSVEFLLNGSLSIIDNTPPYAANFGLTSQGDHTIEAILLDAENIEQTRDINAMIGVDGQEIIAVGDSITNGIGDNYATDNISGRIIGFQGFESNLTDLLNATQTRPTLVINEGIGGDESVDGLSRVNSILARHTGADQILLMYGTNDAGALIPSGEGCNGVACNGTFKGNLQEIIDTAIGKTVTVALLPPIFGSGVNGVPFSDPLTASRNVNYIQVYNAVIRNELTEIQTGPDLFSYFLSPSENRFSLFADNLHPNALGYVSIAHLWHNSLNPGNPTELPFVLNNLSPSTSPPYLKQNLLEAGDKYYVDENMTLSSAPLPAILDNARWVMTANADRSNSSANYVSFALDRSATVYVAYDSGATTLPGWMDSFTNTGVLLETSDPLSPSLTLYSRNYNAGTVVLGGNLAPPANGANSNYIAIVVEN